MLSIEILCVNFDNSISNLLILVMITLFMDCIDLRVTTNGCMKLDIPTIMLSIV